MGRRLNTRESAGGRQTAYDDRYGLLRARLTLGPPNRTYNAATAAIGPLGATPHSWRPTIGRRPILDSAIARERTQRIGATASLVGKNIKDNILTITT